MSIFLNGPSKSKNVFLHEKEKEDDLGKKDDVSKDETKETNDEFNDEEAPKEELDKNKDEEALDETPPEDSEEDSDNNEVVELEDSNVNAAITDTSDPLVARLFQLYEPELARLSYQLPW